jgi:hypothetical protein
MRESVPFRGFQGKAQANFKYCKAIITYLFLDRLSYKKTVNHLI